MFRLLAHLRPLRTNPVLACVLALAMGLGFSASIASLSHWQRGGNMPVMVELARAQVAQSLVVMLALPPKRPVPAAFAPVAKVSSQPKMVFLAFALRSIPPPGLGA
jgi:hypothetical protein